MEAGVAGVWEKRRWEMLDQNKSDNVNYNDTVNTYHDGLTFHFTSFYVILLYCSEWKRPVFRSCCMMHHVLTDWDRTTPVQHHVTTGSESNLRNTRSKGNTKLYSLNELCKSSNNANMPTKISADLNLHKEIPSRMQQTIAICRTLLGLYSIVPPTSDQIPEKI